MGRITLMMNSAFKDSLCVLYPVTLIISGYSMAFTALFNDVSRDKEGEHFVNFGRAFETLTYAGIGSFDVDVRCHTSAPISCDVSIQMFRHSSSLLAAWAAILFGSFVFIGPIVLLSLLVGILTDTYDRVRSSEKAELRKFRMRIVVKLQHQSNSILSAKQVCVYQKMQQKLEPLAQRLCCMAGRNVPKTSAFSKTKNCVRAVKFWSVWTGRISIFWCLPTTKKVKLTMKNGRVDICR